MCDKVALCAGCKEECPTKVCSECNEAVVSCNECSAIPTSTKCTDCVSNVFVTGAPKNAILVGIGPNTKGITMRIREKQLAGAETIWGDFKFKSSSKKLSSLLEKHAGDVMTVNQYKRMKKELLKNQYGNIEKMAAIFAGKVTEESMKSVQAFLFHPSQWAVKS